MEAQSTENLSSESIHEVAGSFALWRQPLGEPLGVSTVIIDHIVISHPLKLLLLVGIQILLYNEVGRRSDSTEVAEGCHKGGFIPVALDEPTSGCPIICIPKAGVYPHCLAIRKMKIVTQLFLPVLEHSNRSPIYRESQVELLLTIAKALSEDISVHHIGIPREVSQKFKVNFVVFRALRR